MKQSLLSSKNPKLLFTIAALLPIPIEAIGILLYQNASYWTDYSTVRPGLNTAGEFIYSHGPLYIILLGGLYLLVAGLIIYLLPRLFSITAGLFFWLSHATGFAQVISYDTVRFLKPQTVEVGNLIVISLTILISVGACFVLALGLQRFLASEKSRKK